MAPVNAIRARIIQNTRDDSNFGNWRDVNDTEAFILEGWGQGFMFGALLIMAIITIANMKSRVLLHKTILLEVIEEFKITKNLEKGADTCCSCSLL